MDICARALLSECFDTHTHNAGAQSMYINIGEVLLYVFYSSTFVLEVGRGLSGEGLEGTFLGAFAAAAAEGCAAAFVGAAPTF